MKQLQTCLFLAAALLMLACGPEFLGQDTDGDGLVNSSDWCPTVNEEPNGFEDEDGCPDVVPPESAQPLDVRFAGMWGGGTITITPLGRPVVHAGRETELHSGVLLFVEPRINDASVRLPCGVGSPGTSPRVAMGGSGRLMQLDVPTSCPPVGPATCPWFITYEHAVALLEEGPSLALTATGAHTDCNGSVPMTVNFTASINR